MDDAEVRLMLVTLTAALDQLRRRAGSRKRWVTRKEYLALADAIRELAGAIAEITNTLIETLEGTDRELQAVAEAVMPLTDPATAARLQSLIERHSTFKPPAS